MYPRFASIARTFSLSRREIATELRQYAADEESENILKQHAANEEKRYLALQRKLAEQVEAQGMLVKAHEEKMAANAEELERIKKEQELGGAMMIGVGTQCTTNHVTDTEVHHHQEV